MSIRGFLTPSAGLALLATLGFSGPAQAWDALPAYNQGTLARAFALPVIGQSRVLNASQSAFSADYDVTTEYYVDANASESITIDGETSAFSLGWRQGLADGLELTARLPVLVVGGGYMDHFVNEWHKAFGLPDGGRPLAQDNQRQITYTANGNTVLDERRSGTTLGDIQLGAGYRLGEGAALRGTGEPGPQLVDLTGEHQRRQRGDLGRRCGSRLRVGPRGLLLDRKRAPILQALDHGVVSFHDGICGLQHCSVPLGRVDGDNRAYRAERGPRAARPHCDASRRALPASP